jgi:hypothetical protein
MGGYTWLSDSQQILIYCCAHMGCNRFPQKSRHTTTGPVPLKKILGKKAPSRTYQDLLKNPV